MASPIDRVDASADPRTTAIHLHIEKTVPRGSGAAARMLHGFALGLALIRIVNWRQPKAQTRWELGRPVYDEDGNIAEVIRDEACRRLMDDYGHLEGFTNTAVDALRPLLVDVDWSYELLGPDAATLIAIQAWAGLNPLPGSASPARRRLPVWRRDAILDMLGGMPMQIDAEGPSYQEIADAILEEGARGSHATREDRMADLIIAGLKAARRAK